jgi:hypothetical protein
LGLGDFSPVPYLGIKQFAHAQAQMAQRGAYNREIGSISGLARERWIEPSPDIQCLRSFMLPIVAILKHVKQ